MPGVLQFTLFANVVVWFASSSNEKTIQKNVVGGNDQPSLLIDGNIPPKNSTKEGWNETSSTVQLRCMCPFLEGSQCSIAQSRATYGSGLSCVLDHHYNASSVETDGGCTCGDVCHTLSVAVNAEGSFSVVVLRKPSCSDAGKYTCETKGQSGYTAKVMASLEMLPGLPEVTSSLQKGGSHSFRPTVFIWFVCRVFSTVRVDFKWLLRYPNGWDLLRSGYADVHVTKPSINKRCEQPWESKLYRELDTHDAGRKYRCFVQYKYRNAVYNSPSARYTLNSTTFAKELRPPQQPSLIHFSPHPPTYQRRADEQSSPQHLPRQQPLLQQPPRQRQYQKRHLPTQIDDEVTSLGQHTTARQDSTTSFSAMTLMVGKIRLESSSQVVPESPTVDYAMVVVGCALAVCSVLLVLAVVSPLSNRLVHHLMGCVMRRGTWGNLAGGGSQTTGEVAGRVSQLEQTSLSLVQLPQPTTWTEPSTNQAPESFQQAPESQVLALRSPTEAAQSLNQTPQCGGVEETLQPPLETHESRDHTSESPVQTPQSLKQTSSETGLTSAGWTDV